jgi:membrane protein required for colicin V production
MEHHIGFNNLDYVVLGIIMLSGALALFRGLVREVFSLIAWVGAYYAAARFHTLAEPWIRPYIHSEDFVGLAAVALVFTATLVVLMVIGALVTPLIKGRALTAIDRSLGFIFGLLRGALIVCIAYLAAVTILWPDIDKPQPIEPVASTVQAQGSAAGSDKNVRRVPKWLMQARTRAFMAYGADLLKGFIPEKEIEETTEEYMEQKAKAQRQIDQQKLDMMSTPVPAAPAPVNSPGTAAPSIDDTNHISPGQLLHQPTE